MNGLDLFSGIGGISVALCDYVRTVAYCELDTFCQAVLLSRMSTGELDNAPIWDDVKTLCGKQFKGHIDIILGGFPCQDISVAGLGKGLEGERSGLFFEIKRLAHEIRPSFIFLENVPAITSRGGTRVITEIAQMGYDCRWLVISAASVGALHKRERWFLLAHAVDNGAFASADRGSTRECALQRQEQREQAESFGQVKRAGCLSSDVANPLREGSQVSSAKQFENESAQYMRTILCNDDSESSQQANTCAESFAREWGTWGRPARHYWPFESIEHWQKTVSEMGKCSHRIQNHVDRLRALGNSVVPCQVREAFEILSGLKK